MERLAKALRDEMERRGHSVRQAAAEMGVASGTVVNWSAGWVKKSPRLEHWQPLATYLGEPMPIILSWLGLLTEAQADQLTSAKGVYVSSVLSSAAA